MCSVGRCNQGDPFGTDADIGYSRGGSTTILNSTGAIYMYGIFVGPRAGARPNLRRLSFPLAYPITTKTRYEPSTAIQQYSTGRSSVLGLSDDGKVWMWESDTGFQIKLAHVDMVGNKVDRVIAGKLLYFEATMRTDVLTIWI